MRSPRFAEATDAVNFQFEQDVAEAFAAIARPATGASAAEAKSLLGLTATEFTAADSDGNGALSKLEAVRILLTKQLGPGKIAASAPAPVVLTSTTQEPTETGCEDLMVECDTFGASMCTSEALATLCKKSCGVCDGQRPASAPAPAPAPGSRSTSTDKDGAKSSETAVAVAVVLVALVVLVAAVVIKRYQGTASSKQPPNAQGFDNPLYATSPAAELQETGATGYMDVGAISSAPPAAKDEAAYQDVGGAPPASALYMDVAPVADGEFGGFEDDGEEDV